MNMLKSLHRPIAALTLVALAACSSSGSTVTPNPSVPQPPSSGGNYPQNIVGIGDSLTAGVQSGTLMGALSSSPVSPLPGNVVPPTQENGWFALFFAQANNIALDPAKFNLDTALGLAAVSPLPLIAAPGLGAQILFGPSGPVTTHLACDSFDNSAYSLNSLNTVRINPVTKTYDLGVPGITMHEAVAMSGPLTGPPPGPVGNTCPNYPAIPGDPTSGALQALVQDESEDFYPVLGSYSASVHPLTQLGVAVSLKPGVTTVWLGANDLLKYVFSAGASPITDTPTQFQADLTSIITQLKSAGSKVIVANLPTVLQTPQFFQGGVPANPAAPGQSLFYYLQVFSNGAISAAQATGIVTALQSQCGVGSGGYFDESGVFALLQMILAGTYNPAGTACPLDTNGPKSGLGVAYLTDSFASTVGQLNAGYNQIIAAVAAGTGTPMVDVNSALSAVYAASNTAPYYYTLPGTSDPVSLRFGGHLIGFDGLHPSNTGYALVANLFIQIADAPAPAGLGLSIPPLPSLDPFYKADPYFIPNPFVPGFPL
jgi:lysophospholipase L1-like esterase